MEPGSEATLSDRCLSTKRAKSHVEKIPSWPFIVNVKRKLYSMHDIFLFIRAIIPVRTVPGSLLLKDLISDFYLTSLQLVLCRVAAVKRLPVHQP